MSQNPEATVCDNGSTPSLQKPTWDFLNKNFTKTELQKHCRELGFNKIWVTKEKLIEMILEKSQDFQSQAPQITVTAASPPSHTTQSYSSPFPPAPSLLPLPCSPSPAPHSLPPLSQFPLPSSPFLPFSPSLPPPTRSSPVSPSPQQATAVTPPQLPSPTQHVGTVDTTDNSVQNNASAIRKISLDLEKMKDKLETKDMEIELLNTEVKTAFSIVDQLTQRVHDLENQIANQQHPHRQEVTNTSTNPPQRILLLGDENWTNVKVRLIITHQIPGQKLCDDIPLTHITTTPQHYQGKGK
ncbi:hypothetical protein Pcinc_034774 [Petrolisthes cinctipes]|uniref:Uncharacterized protein n=1 Tax=Petrolisthes cinctipes TaxID=88211 RepID=A0AAE1C1R8_PETCI|nr:hypothetical protein Pcinc_034774 [Petrolisthes cinctipes]